MSVETDELARRLIGSGAIESAKAWALVSIAESLTDITQAAIAAIVAPQPLGRTSYDFGDTVKTGAACTSCGASYHDCTLGLLERSGQSCCSECYWTDTHDTQED